MPQKDCPDSVGAATMTSDEALKLEFQGGSRAAFDELFAGGPEPITEFVIPVAKWSDGTVAPAM
jgi:hypothetical protein